MRRRRPFGRGKWTGSDSSGQADRNSSGASKSRRAETQRNCKAYVEDPDAYVSGDRKFVIIDGIYGAPRIREALQRINTISAATARVGPLRAGSIISGPRAGFASARGAMRSIPATIGWLTSGTTSCLRAKTATTRNPITSRSRIRNNESEITLNQSAGNRRCS